MIDAADVGIPVNRHHLASKTLSLLSQRFQEIPKAAISKALGKMREVRIGLE